MKFLKTYSEYCEYFKISVQLFQISDLSVIQGCVQSWVCPRHFFIFYMLRLISISSWDWFHSLAGIAGYVRPYHWSLSILWNTLLKCTEASVTPGCCSDHLEWLINCLLFLCLLHVLQQYHQKKVFYFDPQRKH